MNKAYFSGSIIGFIPEQHRTDGTYTEESWQNDAVLMTQDELNEYWKASSPDGKRIGATSEGRPCWVDIPPPPPEEQVMQADATKSTLQREAEGAIKPLERAKQLGIATDEELALLREWEKYSVLLMRVDTSTAPDIVWPLKP